MMRASLVVPLTAMLSTDFSEIITGRHIGNGHDDPGAGCVGLASRVGVDTRTAGTSAASAATAA
jgi:hypothetical protein